MNWARPVVAAAFVSALAVRSVRADDAETPRFRLVPGQSGSASADAVSSSPLAGAIPMPSLSALEPAKKTSDKPSFVAVPLPNSNPTIGTGLGAAGLLFFRPSKKDTVSPSSLLALGGMYFDTKSWAAALGGRFHLREDRWRVTAAIAAADLRYDLSGGGEAGAPAVGVKQKTLGGLVQAQVRMFDRVYGGIRYVLAQVQTDLDSGEISLPTGITPDQANLRVAALGPVFSFDSRDNQFFPLHGWAADLRADFYGHDLGSEYGFQKYELNVRSFFPVRGQDVVAAQAYACGIGGRAPFFLQCLYGSGGVLRGYPVGKYYDETMFGAQVEYRWHFAPRWIAAGFAGIGGVAPTFGSYASDDLLPAAGLGVRWIAEPKEKATLRLDYAWGKDRGTFYLSIGEAF